MPIAFAVPLQVFGIGFVIALGMAVLIKVMLMMIRQFTKEDDTNEVK